MTKRLSYFAYGSNLDETQMHIRCRGARVVDTAVLKDWRLVFRGVADVEPHIGVQVTGVLWSITRDDLRALDRYEGHPYLYTRRTEVVETTEGRRVGAIVYTMVDDSSQSLPSPRYLDGILEGVRNHGVPRAEINEALYRAGAYLRSKGTTRVRITGKRTYAVDGIKREWTSGPTSVAVPTVRTMSPATRLEFELDREPELATQARDEAMALESEEWRERTTGNVIPIRGRRLA